MALRSAVHLMRCRAADVAFFMALGVSACSATTARPTPASDTVRTERDQRADRDGDGIDDARDACPTEPEDCDGHTDDDGCPDLDDDADGILDACDRCPNDPETPNGTDDDDGCPDAARIMTGEDIRIIPHVSFADGSARIDPASLAVLDEIARLMVTNPQLERVSIRGNASRGERDALALSERRARAVVEALVARGVAGDRLEIRGDGDARPLAPNTTTHGRTLNRRVDFEIVRTTQVQSPSPGPVVAPRIGPPGCPGRDTPPPPPRPPPGGCASSR